MSLNSLKESVLNYIHHLTVYEYIAFGWVLFLFTTLLILSVMIANKKPFFSLLLILFNFTLLSLSPILIKIFMEKTVKRAEVRILKQEYLRFGKSVIVEGTVTNKGKIDFRECEIKGKIVKIGSNSLKNLLYLLKPLKRKKIFLKKKLQKGKSLEFRLVFNDFKRSKKDYNVTVDAECY